MAMRAWTWVIVRSSAAAVVRLPLVVLTPLDDRALWLVLLAVGSPALTGWIGGAALLRHPPRRVSRHAVDARTFRFAVTNWLGLVATIGPAFAIPVLVATQLENEIHASFSIAWSIALLVFQVPHLTASVFISESSRPGTHERNTMIALSTGLGVTCAATAVAFMGADVIPHLYGADFEEAAEVLPVMMAATIGWAVTCTNLAVCRVREDNARTVVIGALFGILTMALATAGVIVGDAKGAGTGWLVANVAVAAVSTFIVVGSTSPAPAPAAARA